MDKKKELFETMPLNKAIIQLVIPNIVGSLVMILYNLADTYFVGLLNDPVQTSAVTLISVLLLLFNAINNLFGVGTSSLMSRLLGAKEKKTQRMPVPQVSILAWYLPLHLLSSVLYSKHRFCICWAQMRQHLMLLTGICSGQSMSEHYHPS